MINKYLSNRLLLLLPSLSLLLSLIIVFIFKSSDFVMFCDGEDLYQLKVILVSEATKYGEIVSQFEYFRDLVDEACNHPEIHEDIKVYLKDKVLDTLDEALTSLEKIRATEASITKLEPNFVSPIKKHDFEN